jgi:hypothetical protein
MSRCATLQRHAALALDALASLHSYIHAAFLAAFSGFEAAPHILCGW